MKEDQVRMLSIWAIYAPYPLIPPKACFLHAIHPDQTAHPPVCARYGQLSHETGLCSPFALQIVVFSGPTVFVILNPRPRLAFLPFLEGLDPLPRYRHCYPRLVELREMVTAVVVCGRHDVRPEPPSRELACRLVLVVETGVVNQLPVAFFDLLWS